MSKKDEVINRQNENPVLRSCVSGKNDFTFDHPTINMKKELVDDAVSALEAGQTHYVDVPGIPELRESAAGLLGQAGFCSIQAKNILITTGINEARFLAIQVLADKFGSIAVPAVCDPNIGNILKVRKTEFMAYACNGADFRPLPDEILRSVQMGYKLVYIENPSRLSGKVLEGGQIEEICSILDRNDGFAIMDIGFLPWADWDETAIKALSSRLERFILVGETAPGIGCKGLETAFIAANEEFETLFQVQKQVLSICTSAPTQYASLKAAAVYQEKHSSQKEFLNTEKAKICEKITSHGFKVIPGESANVIAFVDPQGKCLHAYGEKGITLLDGALFGADGITRISVSLDEAKNKMI